MLKLTPKVYLIANDGDYTQMIRRHKDHRRSGGKEYYPPAPSNLPALMIMRVMYKNVDVIVFDSVSLEKGFFSDWEKSLGLVFRGGKDHFSFIARNVDEYLLGKEMFIEKYGRSSMDSYPSQPQSFPSLVVMYVRHTFEKSIGFDGTYLPMDKYDEAIQQSGY